MTDVSKIVKSLKANPIYALSLGSRELFHSNFLGWMFEKYPAMIRVLDGGNITGKTTVFREEHNLDLVITSEENEERSAIVVEIKVKDAPRPDQLERYSEQIDKLYAENAKILLSLVAPPDSTSEGWTYLGFKDLGTKIEEALITDVNPHPDDLTIINFYARMCIDLDDLIEMAARSDKNVRSYFFPISNIPQEAKEIETALSDVKFADTVNKHRASLLRDEIAKKLKEAGLKDSDKFDVESHYGLEDKTPHVGASLTRNLATNPLVSLNLSIHIQGQQYRRMFWFSSFPVAKKGTRNRKADILKFVEATDHWEWLFSETHQDRKFIGEQQGFFEGRDVVSTSQQVNNLLCAYAPKHIYQHTSIGDAQGVPVSEVVNAVIADLKYAARLLDDPEYIERYETWLKSN